MVQVQVGPATCRLLVVHQGSLGVGSSESWWDGMEFFFVWRVGIPTFQEGFIRFDSPKIGLKVEINQILRLFLLPLESQ